MTERLVVVREQGCGSKTDLNDAKNLWIAEKPIW